MSILFPLVHFFIKMSILLLYQRIFTTANRAFVTGLYAIMTYVTVWFIVTLLVVIFNCTPIDFFWRQIEPVTPDGFCVQHIPAEVGLGILNTIGDLATLILPTLALWNLQMSTKRKVAVAAIFLIGILSVSPRRS